MANSNIEIEIRAPLKNPQEAIKYLDKYAQIISKKVYQKDTYYNPKHRDFLKPKYIYEWVET